ncbi:NtaA/DmoA family FMN-dependent monooxygenase [Herbiconiux sp. CPCC 203407]|uniref:NtaA/DmoA family FMN-dependent monooxygenase n=1 Tax=Herbiconiux oxytropis TaxID=2970915 RepID=A0AA41XJ28_9MICO|nr:NtaA/DmoA family FMN-dependent monooxygenase [Herbiconiux oxytropis]MCS5724082.1 NtaA/DmoA family FMN-dependent monooxygenase [Herbiconiux oxytropis]MCS5726985.1 NtaA/DmoA family FMN-dependent monooxygenase [Herbiconiux oxytropis]
MTSDRQLHLLVFGHVPGSLAGAWRIPGVENDRASLLRRLVQTAQVAERGLLDGIFYADALNYGPEATWPHKQPDDFEPITTAAYLAATTERLGLVVTGSSQFQPPYTIARQLLSLDTLSGGRAGWNLVTSFAEAAAANFGDRGVVPHDERYRQAEEVLEIVQKLWDSLESDAVVGDRDRGIYTDVSKLHRTDHRTESFQVRGPLGAHRSPQGQPVIFQAGASTAGTAFAARHADAIFTGHPLLAQSQAFYERIRSEARAAGRSTLPIVTPGLSFVVGSSDEEAARFEETVRESFIPEYQAGWLQEVDIDVTGLPLDGPVPLDRFAAASEKHHTALAGYKTLATEGNPSLREFLYRTISAFGLRVVGSPERIADEIQFRYENGAADGFILQPPVVPDQLELFVEHVVPLLQQRGLFRREYAGTTLRDHLGLTPPANRHTAARAHTLTAAR